MEHHYAVTTSVFVDLTRTLKAHETTQAAKALRAKTA